MKKKMLKIGILYLSFHNSLRKVYGTGKIVSEEDLIIKLGRQFLVPKRLRLLAVKELVKRNLIKRESNKEFKILNYEFDIEKDTNEFLKKMNWFSIF